jgi:hypothetical protein
MKTNIPLLRPVRLARRCCTAKPAATPKTNLLPFSQPNLALVIDFHKVD